MGGERFEGRGRGGFGRGSGGEKGFRGGGRAVAICANVLAGSFFLSFFLGGGEALGIFSMQADCGKEYIRLIQQNLGKPVLVDFRRGRGGGLLGWRLRVRSTTAGCG